MGYVACIGQIPEETAHVLQNLVSANGISLFTVGYSNAIFKSECRPIHHGERYNACNH